MNIGRDNPLWKMSVDKLEGSYAAGDRVRKVGSDERDAHRDGAAGRVLKVLPVSIPTDNDGQEFAYFVEWDDLPGMPVFIRGSRLEAA
jgi:hypothetical protein